MRPFILLLPILTWCCAPAPSDAGPAPEPEVAAAAPRFDPALIQRAKMAILADHRVTDVLFDDGPLSYTWQIGVFDDGTRRDGLAEAFCLDLSDIGAVDDFTRVRIVDFAAVSQNGGDFRAAELGTAECGST